MKTARLALLAVLVLALAACGGGDDETSPTTEAFGTETTTTEESTTTSASGGSKCETVEAPEPKPDGGAEAPEGELAADTTYRLVVETNCGSFTIALDQRTAPSTAASLVALARNGFFDDVSFHRVVPGFVIQGGDPTGTGTGGPGYKTVDVPPGDAQYVQGVVAMAKSGVEPPGTSGSQFFVVTGPDAQLPAEYAVVGEVTSGLETVLKIDALGTGDGPPSIPVVIEKVTVEES
ncbi:MAG: peptidylprolyl isomerase [Actinobacteria bacterium]|nr:peptidylprolyl isomerase [Actinomycetota bacterium]